MIMDELLHRLEWQIKRLIDQQNQLKQSNQNLLHTKGNLAREREAMLSHQQRAITQIETLVSRLKAIEKLT